MSAMILPDGFSVSPVLMILDEEKRLYYFGEPKWVSERADFVPGIPDEKTITVKMTANAIRAIIKGITSDNFKHWLEEIAQTIELESTDNDNVPVTIIPAKRERK